MLFLADSGCRVIAHDPRSHGRSIQIWNGNEVETIADELAATPVGSRPARSSPRSAGAARLAQVEMPFGLHTEGRPGGVSQDVFEAICGGSVADCSQLCARWLAALLQRQPARR